MYGVTILLSAKPAVRFIMCLVKRKLNRARGNVSGKQQVDVRKWSSRTSSRVNQHDSSSSIELPSGSAGFSERHSRESQVSNSSGASRNSLFSLKEVVGDGAIVFQYKELSIATECFSPSKKVGNSVYRGCVRGGTEVAIAIHKKGGLYTDFVPKLKTLCSVHHCNVVSMIGACSTEPGDYVYLVYQYVEGSRLRDCIRSVHSPGYSVLDTWTRRLRIAVDVAKGLEYLHEGTSMPMVHKYVKSSNILVDSENLRAKIAQFGIADLTGEVPPVHFLSRTTSSSTIGSSSEVTEVVMEEPPSPGTPRRRLTRSRSRKLTGTKGYMAPEYLKSGAVTAKLDVFAFGVVMLELLSGREPITYRADTTSGKNTIKNYTLFEAIRAIFDNPDPRARLREWVDPVLKDSYPLHLAVKVAQLAKSCVENDPVLRPEMRTVALELSRIMMASEKWEASMDLSKALMSRTMEAR